LAEPLYRETLQLLEKVLGMEHPSTLTSMNNLAALLDSQGEGPWQGAPNTLTSMNNLAGLFKSHGKSSRPRTLVAGRRGRRLLYNGIRPLWRCCLRRVKKNTEYSCEGYTRQGDTQRSRPVYASYTTIPKTVFKSLEKD